MAGFLMARGTPDVDEVVNDTFAAAFHRLHAFSGAEPEFQAWLFAIARNKRIDQLRRHGRSPDATSLGDHAGGTEIQAAEHEALRRLGDQELLDVLESLTPEQRDVIVLRFVSDLSLQQTAAATGMTIGAVKAMQRRALDQLRKKFPRNPYPSVDEPTI